MLKMLFLADADVTSPSARHFAADPKGRRVVGATVTHVQPQPVPAPLLVLRRVL